MCMLAFLFFGAAKTFGMKCTRSSFHALPCLALTPARALATQGAVLTTRVYEFMTVQTMVADYETDWYTDASTLHMHMPVPPCLSPSLPVPTNDHPPSDAPPRLPPQCRRLYSD